MPSTVQVLTEDLVKAMSAHRHFLTLIGAVLWKKFPIVEDRRVIRMELLLKTVMALVSGTMNTNIIQYHPIWLYQAQIASRGIPMLAIVTITLERFRMDIRILTTTQTTRLFITSQVAIIQGINIVRAQASIHQ